MKRLLLSLVLIGTSLMLDAQTSKNVDLVGRLTYQRELSDVWGYTDSLDREYALVGVYNGFSIVDVSNPSTPVELFFVPGANTTWRDMKVWDGFAYVTNENSSGGGLLIVDLRHLPDTIYTSTWTGSGNVNFQSAHNIFIDEKGYGYIVGANYLRGGAIIVDLFTTPGSPQLVTVYNERYVHDCFVRGDTLWTAEINNGLFSVVDVSNKNFTVLPASKVMATQQTPLRFTHNLWLSDDGKYLFTTDERPNAPVACYDVSDLGNIKFTDEYRSSPGSNVIPHNVFVKGDFTLTAYYRDGLSVADVSDPHNIIETGWYDSSPMAGSGFNGAWGVYPYLTSGLVLVTDIEQGLFVLRTHNTKAARIQGTVSDSVTKAPLNGVDITFVGHSGADRNTDLFGEYRTGVADSGTYTLIFRKFGYKPDTLSGLNVTNGQTLVVDVELVPLPKFTLKGIVVDAATVAGVPNAHVWVINPEAEFNLIAGSDGRFSLPGLVEDNYTIYAGAWGHQTREMTDLLLSVTRDSVTVPLSVGYYDDYMFDFGWIVIDSVVTGAWEWGVPIGTYHQSMPGLPINPNSDVPYDFGLTCYVTGNGGGGVGDDDIDDGYTVLVSPRMNLSNVADPELHFSYWFVNILGSGTPNDSMALFLSNRDSTVRIAIATNTTPDPAMWNRRSLRLKDHLTPDDSVVVGFYANDLPPGHIVEAAVDMVYITDLGHTLPQAGFTVDTTLICQGSAVQFTDLSTGTVTNWHWVLPGTALGYSNLKDPAVTYESAGTWPVTLIVSNSSGADTLKGTVAIEVLEAPRVGFIITPANFGYINGAIHVYSVIAGQEPINVYWHPPLDTIALEIYLVGMGIYHYTLTDSNGCTASGSVNVPSTITGIAHGETGNWQIALHPNPARGETYVTYDIPASGGLTFHLMDITGRDVWMQHAPTGSGTLQVPLVGPPGLYLLRVSSEGRSATLKVMVH